MLQVRDLHAYYDKSHVLQGVSLEVVAGGVVSILGRNGVGKTTLLRSILGLTPPQRKGSIVFEDVEISSLAPYKVANMGVAFVPQGRHIFPRLTVLENLKIPITARKLGNEGIEEAFAYFPVLKDRAKQRGGTLSGGEQQMLALARAMVAKPKLTILDEPTEGLQPSLVFLVREWIKSIHQRGIAMVIADQNLENALDVCDKAYILEKGVVKYEAKREDLNIDLLREYLGITERK